MSNVAPTASYTEQGAAVTLSSGATVSDVDNTTLASATVSISGGTFFTGDTLAATTAGTSITASYNTATGVLSLTGTDTLAHYQAVLDSVAYSSSSQNPTNYGADTSRSISWVVNDGTLNSTAASSTISITAVDNAPVIANVAPTASYTEQGAAVTLSSGATVSDVDNTTLASATVSISGGTFFTGDTLAATTAGTSITASYNTATGVLSLTGTDTLAHYQAVLDSVAYSSSSQNPTNYGADTSRSISWVVNDGTLNSTAASSTISITAVDNAPVIANVAPTASYTEQGAAVTLSSGATVSDVDNTTLASATVSISGGTFFTGDTLAATTAGTSITASYNTATGVLSLTGTDTLAHYQAVLDSVAYSSSSQNPTNYGADTSRSISWVVNDGTLNSTAASSTISITAVDNAPVIANVAPTASYTEQGAAVTLSSGATVSDVDNTTLASATVSISGGTFFTGDTLAATTAGTSITASYNTATGVLSLTGTDTLAHYQAVLDSVAYSSSSQNPTNYGADTSRSISWVVNDGTLNSTAASSTISITAVDNAPVIANVAPTASYTEQGAAVTLSSGATVSDVDNTTLASATVSISGGTFFTGDTLAATTAGTSITASYNTATGVLSLTGTDTLAHYQAVLDSVAYSSSSQNPTNYGADTSRSISWVVNDGTLNSTAASSTISITAVDNAPVIANVAPTASYTEQGAAVTLSSGATVSDVDNTTLASATVSISGGTFFTGDTLAATTAGTSITASYNTATGVLSLTGTDTLAHYQAVLDSVAYSSSSQNPTNYGADTSRSISWVVNDGTLNSTAASSTISITAVDNAPVIANVSGSVSTNLNTPVTLAAATGTVTDVDAAPTDLLLATLSVAHGTLTPIGSVPGLTIVGGQDGSNGTLSFTGTQAAITQAIETGVTYTPTLNYNGSDQLTFTVNDQGHTGTGGPQTATATVGITVSADQAPVIANVAPTASYTEQGAAVTLSSGATVSDVDNTTLASATVSISGGTFFTGDTLAATTAGTSITASYNTATGVLSLTGTDTLAHYQAVLDSVAYSSSSQNPTNYGADTSRSISWVVNDGTLNSTAASSTISITAVDNAPVIANVAPTASYTEQGAAVTLSSGATVSDVDNTTLASATVSISGGTFFTGDTLAATTAGTSITASYNTATGVLSLTGTDTLAHYQAVLDSVAYSSSSQNPTNYGADTSRSISWVVNDGTLNSTAASSTISITAVDNAPVMANVAPTASYTEQGAAVTLSSGATVSDVDNTTLASATVSISGGTFFTGDTLAATTAGTSITASYNTATGVLSLTGTDTLAHYQAVLDSVAYSSSSQNPTNYGADTSRSISWVVNDGTLNSTAASSTISITAVDNAPVIANVAPTASYTEQGAAVTLSSGATVSDVDNTTLASATVSISGGTFFTGDTLAATTAGTSITASYNAATGVLSLTGTDTLAHYQAVLDSVAYSSSSQNPTNYGADTSRSISWVVNDGTLNSTAASSTISITAVDNAPVIANVAPTASYTEQGAAVTLSSGATVSDVDNTTLASATVSISGGTFFTGDTLAATTAGTSITASYNTATGVLSLSGTDTLAHYQAVLDSVAYSSSSTDPTNTGTDNSRTISWVANDGALNSATQTTIVSILPKSTAYVWGTDDFLGPAVSGTHIYSPYIAVNYSQNILGVMYGATSSNYNPSGPDAVSLNFIGFDPFFLTTNQNTLFIDSTVQQFPSPYFFSIPNISPTNAEGIAIYQTEDGSGNRFLNEAFVTGNNNNTLNVGGATQIAALSYTTENSIFFQFTESSGTLTSYAVAYDQYDQADGIYTINLENFVHISGDPYNSSSDFTAYVPAIPALTFTGLFGGRTTLPAWFFNSVTTSTGSGVYMLGYAENDAPHSGEDYIEFLSYTQTGALNATINSGLGYFEIAPDLLAYGQHTLGDTTVHNQITLEATDGTHTGNPTSLFFTQPGGSGPLFVAWNETVKVDGNPNTYDQVEFVRHAPFIAGQVDQYFTYQIPDGQAQNVKLQAHGVGAGTVVYLAYGDGASTTIVEFFYNSSAQTTTEIGSYTEATPDGQTYNNIRDLGDGRVAIIYDDQINSNGTTQVSTNIVDFRTTPWNMSTSVAGTQDQYYAGTQFNDKVFGENDVNNFYYYIGQNTTVGPGPTDTFTGGDNGINVAIFSDPISDYTISAVQADGSIIITNIGDSAHAGSLEITGIETAPGVYVPSVQVLAFGPSKDPIQTNNEVEASAGSTFYVASPLNSPVIIDSGASVEFGIAANGVNDSITFADTGGTLKLDTAAQGSQSVGYYIDSSGKNHGFVDNNGVFSTVDDPLGANGSMCVAINSAGWIVGSYVDGSGTSHGFLESGGTFSTIDDPLGAKGTTIFGINDFGQIVGTYTDSSGTSHGFVDNNGVFTSADVPGASGTVVFGINSSGQLSGYYTDSSGKSHGFVSNGNGNFTTIDDPLGTNGTRAQSINSAGEVVGFYFDSSNVQHGFLYSGGTFTTVDDSAGRWRDACQWYK